ncbi:MAG TPA: hypothetical protein VHC93_09095 [Methylomirabilota bacterium]|nr:hypothetical protein [Methylomirabilota bacterium]
MPSLRFKLLGGVIIGLLAVIVSLTMLLGRSHRAATPRSEPGPAAAALDSAAPQTDTAPAAAPARPSRSRGQSDWTFFFRVGDTLSRMSDGAALGVVVRLERTHAFPDGTGPAYVIRSQDQREVVFDADDLERSARIEAIREIARPPLGTPAR